MSAAPSNKNSFEVIQYAVECMIPINDVITVFVEASSVEDACRLATDQANLSPDWTRMDDCGEIFVVGIGANPEPDDPTEAIDCSDIDIPNHYGEPGKRSNVRVIVEGGRVRDVIVSNGRVEMDVEYRDGVHSKRDSQRGAGDDCISTFPNRRG